MNIFTNVIDLYSKKTITYKHGRYNIQLQSSQELFSSIDVDRGTQRLLRTLLFENIHSYNKILDIGCGYGPIGITMKTACPSAEIHMVDVDMLALAFAQQNARLNGFEDMLTYASLGYDQIKDRNFNIIVSNIPAKIGEKAIKHFLKDAQYYLAKNGTVIVVVIDAIADFVRKQLESDENIFVNYHHSWPGHHVYHYRFVASEPRAVKKLSAFEEGVFFRGKQKFSNSIGEYTYDVSNNLIEFDQLSYKTTLLFKVLKKVTDPVKSASCFCVGQGHLPFFVVKHFGLSTIELIDRNLLALKTAAHNLESHNITVQTIHAVVPKSEKGSDILVGIFPDKQNQNVNTAFVNSLNKCVHIGGKIAIVASTTTINRIEEILMPCFKILIQEKERGNTALIIQKQC